MIFTALVAGADGYCFGGVERMRQKVIYGLLALAAVLLVRNLYAIFLSLPDEVQQGQIFRIIFFHVPAAIAAMLGFGGGAGRERAVSWHEEFQVRCDGRGGHRSRAGILWPSNLVTGSHLGAHHLGRLVDLGCAAHLRAGLLAALRRLPDAAPAPSKSRRSAPRSPPSTRSSRSPMCRSSTFRSSGGARSIRSRCSSARRRLVRPAMERRALLEPAGAVPVRAPC